MDGVEVGVGVGVSVSVGVSEPGVSVAVTEGVGPDISFLDIMGRKTYQKGVSAAAGGAMLVGVAVNIIICVVEVDMGVGVFVGVAVQAFVQLEQSPVPPGLA